MASKRRVAHAGLASASLVLLSTLTILFRGNDAPLVGQQEIRHAGGVVAAGDAVRQTTARAAVNVAVVNK
jgi:hypothetical protein